MKRFIISTLSLIALSSKETPQDRQYLSSVNSLLETLDED